MLEAFASRTVVMLFTIIKLYMKVINIYKGPRNRNADWNSPNNMDISMYKIM